MRAGSGLLNVFNNEWLVCKEVKANDKLRCKDDLALIICISDLQSVQQ